jgi:hypothetical protein
MVPAAGAVAPDIASFEASPSETQAGGHADLEYHAFFNNRAFDENELKYNPGTCNCMDLKTLTVHFPTGVIGNPSAIPRCTLADFGDYECPVESQVGMTDPGIKGESFGFTPVYNLVPHEGEAGLVGFIVPFTNAPAFVTLKPRTGSDYGLDAVSESQYHLAPITFLNVFVWGVPADPSHDFLRRPFKPTAFCFQETLDNPCYPPVPSNAPLRPYLQNPTTCGVPLTVSIDALFYDGQSRHAEQAWPGTTGCDQLSFNPSLSAVPTTRETDSASGVDINLSVPQKQSPTVPSGSEIREVQVTLPVGFSINPNAADGKVACEDAQSAFGTEGPGECPELSKIGSLSIDSSALPGPLPGYIYLGAPKPGKMFRLWLIADGFGVHVKLPGDVSADPETGQLVTTFADLPQTPFQGFDMHFFGSERGLLSTPTRCGRYAVVSRFVPWNSALPAQGSTQFFDLLSGPAGSPCPTNPRRFAPRMTAGTSDNTAGALAPLDLRIDRDDGDQYLSSADVSLPQGLLAAPRGIPYCPQPAIDRLSSAGYTGRDEMASSACPVASQVGSLVAGVGAGTHPLYAPGKIYLAGPYNGAPLSLLFVVPAVSGPYDLGVATVRTAAYVDPVTTEVKAVSDRIPQILAGVPLRLRSLVLDFDRPAFFRNPTDCSPMAITSQIFGADGATAGPGQHFQVANCVDLGFNPQLSLALTGSMKRRGHPGVVATLKANSGEANLARTSVALPPTAILDNAHIKSPCTRVQFAADACPSSSAIGTAEARSPLLNLPLRGKVYLRSSSDVLPSLVLDLKGQIDVEVSARIDSAKNDGLRVTFASVPDAPIDEVRLRLPAGRKSLIQNTESLCRKPQLATVRLTGQNGLKVGGRNRLETPCRSRAHHRRTRRG